MVPEISTGRGGQNHENTTREGPRTDFKGRLHSVGILKLGGDAHDSLASGKVSVMSLRSRSSLVAYTRRQAGDWLGPIKT